jgi:signal transduction histidine kinase
MNWSPETHRLLGDASGEQAPSFESFLDRVHPFDRDRVAETMLQAMDRGDAYATEFSVGGYDQAPRWVMARGKALRNGKPLRMLGVFVDISRHHQVEQELREVGGRLINAHEQERRRISRELHDDVGQRLAVLSIEFDRIRRQLRDLPGSIAELSAQVQEIGAVLQRLSHELHPARLHQLGLEESIRSVCNDMAKSRALMIDFQGAIVGTVSPAAALCLFRVTQEALHNVIRHSQATHVTVSISCTSTTACLTVTDNGVGFDANLLRAKTLGLISMRERARLLQGHFALATSVGGGTRVEVTVPVTAVNPV